MPDGLPTEWNPQVGDTVYIAEYGHGAREGKIAFLGAKLFYIDLVEDGTARGVYKVYRTAVEAEEVSR